MNVEQIIQYLKLPSRVVVKKRITKKIVLENNTLSSGERNIIKKFVQMMYWIGVIKNSNTNIPVNIDTDQVFDEVQIIIVEINNKEKFEKVAQVIQKVIPYHLLLVIIYQNMINFNVAVKRVNLKEPDKRVIEEFVITKWWDADAELKILKKLFTCLTLEELSHKDIKQLYYDIVKCIKSFMLSKVSRRFVVQEDDVLDIGIQYLQRLDEIDSEIDSARNLLNKETQYNRKVEMNLAIKKLENEKRKIISNLS